MSGGLWHFVGGFVVCLWITRGLAGAEKDQGVVPPAGAVLRESRETEDEMERARR
jgi:hypothetical protein